MCESVLWNRLKLTQNLPPKQTKKTKKSNSSQPREYQSKLDHTCPQMGHLVCSPSSCKTHPSRKCGCSAQFLVMHHIAPNLLCVTWYWEHNHKLGSMSDVVASGHPPPVEKWLDQQVVSGSSCSKILNSIQSPEVLALENANAISAGCAIGYEQIRYLIKKQANFLAKKDTDVFKSLSMWKALLKSNNWMVHIPVLENSPKFIFAVYSPWQKQMLIKHGQRMIMIDSTHN
ncbi:hypothetical protein PCANC_10321 [Puccinia coronata f. sp. avenae]|uniref:SWIM-type domain-containing protein n=1 Tax=Puccinia coronata f. sp. avenae TaxID=200324 RepID=A0A2N5SXK9_9BASI|nr:hypothetical protein PCANC_10321 [Puccinia coronata f. sp. avenae]